MIDPTSAPSLLATAVAALPEPVMMKAPNGTEIPVTLIFDREQAIREVFKAVKFDGMAAVADRYENADRRRDVLLEATMRLRPLLRQAREGELGWDDFEACVAHIRELARDLFAPLPDPEEEGTDPA